MCMIMGTKKEENVVKLDPELEECLKKPFLEERLDCSVKYLGSEMKKNTEAVDKQSNLLESLENTIGSTQSILTTQTKTITNIQSVITNQSGVLGRIEDKLNKVTAETLPEIKKMMATKKDIEKIMEKLDKL